MKSLIIGSSNNLKKISEFLIEKIDDLIFLNSEQFKFSSWITLNRDNITFYNGEAKEMETLLKAGLEDSDIIIIDTGDDIESLFVAQKKPPGYLSPLYMHDEIEFSKFRKTFLLY